MFKKLAILFSLVLIAIGTSAQLPVGGWSFHPTFNGVSSITETKGMVYYLSGTSLYSVDKKTRELRSLNIANDLNGSSISNIFTQPDGNYIIVVYTDNNMDRLNDDGSVINISDIKDATINGKTGIKHVGFGKGKYYVSTEFGLVTFDEKKNEARETMFTPLPVVCAYGLGDKVIISYDTHLMAADASKKLISLDQFSLIGGNETAVNLSGKGLPIGDNRLLLITTSNNPVVAHFDFADDKLIYFTNAPISGVVGIFNMGKDQGVAYNGTTVVTYNPTDNPAAPATLTLPAALKNHKISATQGWDQTWAGNTAGVAEFDLSTFNSPIQLCDKFGTTEFTAAQCCRIFTQPSGDLYFWNPYAETGMQMGNYPTTDPLRITSYNRNDRFKNITPNKWASGSAATIPLGMWVTQDPRKPERYYVSNWGGGIYIIEDNTIIGQINNSNSTLSNAISYRITYMGFDKFDNMWVTQETLLPTKNLHVISYDDLHSGAITKDMWTAFEGGNFGRTTAATSLNQSGMMVFSRGFWGDFLSFVNTNNTASPSDDQITVVTSFIDQDNNTLTYYFINALTEDAKGRLWVGYNNGVFEITDPSQINSSTAKINHLKVPRNDGTGLADYLLDTQFVTGIACDNSNRKWISTTTNGVYLVSENGDEILENFTTNNSILPSNRVWSVACDPNSASVFFATDAGVVEYNSTSAPSMKNLDDVYAYPNPVRPDYSGWITVAGLMDNTLVKIADAAGNVFFQGRSEGGMITWDGCNAAGERVKTGVYYVFASHGTSGESSEGCVTKIMVVN